MPSDQSIPKANIRAPTDLQEATELLAEARYSRHNKVSKSEIFRQAVREYLARQSDLPEEARDLLDEDLKADAGDDQVTVEEQEGASDEDVAESIEEAGS
jgi:hypothetical protein